MSNRWSMLAFQCGSAKSALSVLFDYLPSAGLSLEFPGTTVVKILNDVGEQHEGTREDLVRLLIEEHTLTFQWWWSDCEDVCCRIRVVSGAAIVDFYLDGLDDNQEKRLFSCVKRIYDSLAQQRVALGLVVDTEGGTQAYDWFGILTTDKPINGEVPQLVIVPRTTGDRLVRQSPHPLKVQEEGEQLILRRDT